MIVTSCCDWRHNFRFRLNNGHTHTRRLIYWIGMKGIKRKADRKKKKKKFHRYLIYCNVLQWLQCSMLFRRMKSRQSLGESTLSTCASIISDPICRVHTTFRSVLSCKYCRGIRWRTTGARTRTEFSVGEPSSPSVKFNSSCSAFSFCVAFFLFLFKNEKIFYSSSLSCFGWALLSPSWHWAH